MSHAIIIAALFFSETGVTASTETQRPAIPASTEVPPPATHTLSNRNATELPQWDNRVSIRLGSTTLTSGKLRFSKSDKLTSQQEGTSANSVILMLEDDARCSIGDGDVVIVSDRLTIETDGSEITSVIGLGHCEYVDGEGEGLKVRSNKVELGKNGLLFDGQVQLLGPKGTVINARSLKLGPDENENVRVHASGETIITLRKLR